MTTAEHEARRQALAARCDASDAAVAMFERRLAALTAVVAAGAATSATRQQVAALQAALDQQKAAERDLDRDVAAWWAAARARQVATVLADGVTAREVLKRPAAYAAAQHYVHSGRWTRNGRRAWGTAVAHAAARITSGATTQRPADSDVDALADQLLATRSARR